MYKKATLICPRCKMADAMTIEESEQFPNKCDKCGSTNVMITHLVTNMKSVDSEEPVMAKKPGRPRLESARA